MYFCVHLLEFHHKILMNVYYSVHIQKRYLLGKKIKRQNRTDLGIWGRRVEGQARIEFVMKKRSVAVV